LAASYEISDSLDKGHKPIVISKIEKDSSLFARNDNRTDKVVRSRKISPLIPRPIGQPVPLATRLTDMLCLPYLLGSS